MYENSYPRKRFQKTLAFLKKHVPENSHILDLGVDNPLAELMRKEGYQVKNTSGKDLDNDQSEVQNSEADVVTAFEIFEHLLAPYEVLKSIKADKLVASVPLKLWFASAYRSKSDIRDRHYHEFEPWQFNWALEKAGWEIVDAEQFTHPVKKFGIRPILRLFYPRYYLVYARRKTGAS